MGSLENKKSILDKSRILFLMAQKISEFLGVDSKNISFVPNSTYALNEISIHLFSKYPNKSVYLSSSEHSSNHVVWMNFFGKQVSYFEIDDFDN